VWLPVDGTLRPPLAYHLSQALLLTPASSWTLRFEAYYKHQAHGIVLNHTLPDSLGTAPDVLDTSPFLERAQGRAYGAAASAAWRTRRLRTEVSYEYSHATRRSEALFEGRTVPVPWNEPHRLNLAFDWLPTPALTASARWQGVWGRPWGFRRAYYDYLAADPETRVHGPHDFGHPEDHVLPPLYQLDVSVAYTMPAGPARLQIRADVLNVLDRDNVADWRLVYEDGSLQKVARPLYPRMPAVAVRVSW
jgi:hypothetical protein